MSLSSRSMQVTLHQRIWQAQSTDRALAATVEKTTEAKNRTMKVLKQLAPTDYLLPIRRIAVFGREQHERLTLPGLQRGVQLLATKLFDEYALGQAEIRESFFVEVKRFCGIYPEIVEEAPKRLGKAFRAMDFPSADRIASYFDYNVRFLPVPEAGNWLLDDVDIEDVNRLRNEVENQNNEMFREATAELFNRAIGVLENLSTQAKEYVEGPSSGARLREATINSVKDMAMLISSMNIINDPLLAATATEMQEKFANVEAYELRHNAETRKTVSDAAERLIAKLKKGAA